MVDRTELKFAYAHDWLVGLRGGELVLDQLIQQFGTAPIYTLVSNRTPLTPAIDACPQVTSMLQRIPGASGSLRRWLLPLMPMAVGQLRVEPCDVLISTSSCVMKSIRPPAGAVHVCYCHSPARYIWSQPESYKSAMIASGLRLVRGPFQKWDRRTADRVHSFVASSNYIAQRIKDCFGREATVIAPPVRTDVFTMDASVKREDFLLIAAALEPFKRIDLAIEAANRLKRKLVVAGSGTLESELSRLAGPTVEFVGQQSAAQLVNLARRAQAFLFPSLEDFGIAPVEAMACGCPVIALNAGGALDTVTERTGVFFDERSVDSLVGAIQELDRHPRNASDCRENAERFSAERFDAEIRTHIDSLLTARR